MTDKKLTDEDVIEGLERCISTTTDKACAGCPFNKQNLCDIDQWALEKYALDLIKRQKAEIVKLKDYNEELLAEIRKLKGSTIVDNVTENQERIRREVEVCKAFAEHLKEEWVNNCYDNPNVDFDKFVDNLLIKEIIDDNSKNYMRYIKKLEVTEK